MPIDLNTLQNYYSKNFDNAQQAQKSFADMLRERSQFVQNAENGVGDQASNFIKNGSNGVMISPAATLDPVMNFHTDNANKTAQLTQQMFGFGQQSNDAAKGLQDLLALASNQGIANRQQNREDYIAGYNPNGETNGNGIDNPNQAFAQLQQDKGADLIPKGATPAQTNNILKQIKDAGGVRQYRIKNNLPLPDKNDSDAVKATNDTLRKVSYIQDRIANSPALQKFLGDPIFGKGLLSGLQDKNFGKAADKILSPQDQEALAMISQLNASNDIKTAGGGRVSSYALQAFGPTGVSGSKSAKANQVLLDTMKHNLVHDAGTTAQQYGYSSIYDLPGVDFHKGDKTTFLHVQTSDGKKGYVPARNYNPSKYQVIE